jgi:hypothetical protein
MTSKHFGKGFARKNDVMNDGIVGSVVPLSPRRYVGCEQNPF